MHPTRLNALNEIPSHSDYMSEQEPHGKISDKFGELTFSHSRMRASLTGSRLEAFEDAINAQKPLDPEVSKVLATEIKNWAIKHGATHFTHWFQPLTGLTAEKHDSFVSLDGKGELIEKFSPSQLIQSEPDASSFPSGGMRTTFEARGYTAWDISSPVFITEHAGAKILCIPSVFVSYTGHSLDTKTGLMRSMSLLDRAVKDFLSELGENTSKVTATVGCEQEYFLIDKNFARLRPDVLLTGRTLVGGDMPKGQELSDHYFGAIPTRIQAFMSTVEDELYRLGVPVKTRHNEVAPSQFEMAPIFENANLASDHNMLMMEVLRRTASKQGLVCLLHEKPFAGVNGSGKHNNWSMSTAEGENLLEPGNTPAQNFRFLAVLSSVVRAVFKNQVPLRAAIAGHGNDHRLGANEAPPAILSVFLGSTLSNILDHLEKGNDLSNIDAEKAMIDFGINTLPKLPKDNTDRNRTSPFAFTGNKFEFRAVGSSQNVSYPATLLNAAVAESITEFTTRLREVKEKAASRESAILEVAREFTAESKGIRFEGNGYSDEWRKEAASRGLTELLTSADAFDAFNKKENHAFLIEQGVYSEAEFQSIHNVQVENYTTSLRIEVDTMGTLVRQHVLPAAQRHQGELARTLEALDEVDVTSKPQKRALEEITELIGKAYTLSEELDKMADKADEVADEHQRAKTYASEVLPKMEDLRTYCDRLERVVSDELWTLPKYREMLFIR